MLQYILILLLAQEITANYGYRNYYKSHPGYYGRQKGYGYKKPFDGYEKAVNTYKKPGTAVTPYCRCIKETTMLNLVVLDQSGTHLSNAAVWVRYEGQAKEAKTDKKGFLKVEVRGCEIAIIVWHDGKQAESRILNLERTKTKYKNVVIQIGKACNFLIFLYSSTELYSSPEPSFGKELISYLADINGGDQSTSGTAVVGADASPLCINVQDGGSLKIVVTSQSADLFSVLCLDEVKEGGKTFMVLPFPLTRRLAQRSITAYSFLTGVNVYRVNRCGISEVLECETTSRTECSPTTVTECYRGQGYQQVCQQVARKECKTFSDQNCGIREKGVCGDNHNRLLRMQDTAIQYLEEERVRFVNKISSIFIFNSVLLDDGLERTNYLVSVRLQSAGTDLYQGNAYIIDRSGVTKVVKFPSEPYPEFQWWILGCIIDGNLNKWKEINKFSTIIPFEDGIEDFQKLCEEGILPVQIPAPDDHRVDENDKLDNSQIDYDGLKSTGGGFIINDGEFN